MMPIYLNNGLQVIQSNFIDKESIFYQFNFPKSKKKRIRKKWSKNKSNFKYKFVEKVLKMGDKIYVSKDVFEKLKKEVNNGFVLSVM